MARPFSTQQSCFSVFMCNLSFFMVTSFFSVLTEPGLFILLLWGSLISFHTVAIMCYVVINQLVHIVGFVSWTLSLFCDPPSPFIFLFIFSLTQGWQTLASQLSGFVNKILLEPSHARLLTYFLWLLQITVAEVSRCDRD